MRGYIKVTSCLLSLSMLVGCVKSNTVGSGDFKVQIKGMNLDGAKAMAHLQSGNPGTKASMEFGQEEALYLVYDNNEIRLPEIKFTVEAPDSWSAWDKKKWLEAIHVNIKDPLIKDFGEYIYVFSSLDYYIDGHGILSCPPHQIMLKPGHMPDRPHNNTLVRKKDGLCVTVDDNIGVLLYWGSSIMKDSNGHAYFVSFSSDSYQICRLYDENGRIDIKSTNLFDYGHQYLRPQFLECNGDIYVASSYQYEEDGMTNAKTLLDKVSSDLTIEKTCLEGHLLGFEKCGDNAYLFVQDYSGFKVYDTGCELVASAAIEDSQVSPLISSADGVFVYYYHNGFIVRFDAKNRECSVSELKTIRNYLSYWNIYYKGKIYVLHCPSEEIFVEVLKVDVMTETVEQLKKISVPEGCLFNCTLHLVDESTGTLGVEGHIVRSDDGTLVEEVREKIVDPEIAQAYADDVAAKYYGIDFGTYKVVNVVPLTDDLASSEN